VKQGTKTIRLDSTHADEYDAWFDTEVGKAIFAMEVDCLKPILHRYSRPYLEVGVGSGRFAQALGIEYGVDPALTLLRKAKSRGIQVQSASGEKLPFPSNSFGGVLVALTLCFVDNPARVLQEVSRVLMPSGGLALGLILKESLWADFYARKGKEGHPIYSRAQFFSKDEIENLLQQSGFEVVKYRSVLFQPPGQSFYHFEQPANCYNKSAGFVALGSRKRRSKMTEIDPRA
jgi:ubiquinone/menaquinone biosynthesis C-methylase UbiE